jgi:transposase InsO family protein
MTEMTVCRIGSGKQVAGTATFLPVLVAGRPIRFLVDTGASVTILNSSLYQDLPADKRPQLQPPSQYTHIEVADKGMLAIDGEAELTFTTTGETFTWKVLVAPIGDDGLLGLDFLCAHQFNLGVETGLSLCGVDVAVEWKGRTAPAGRAVLALSEMIPANSECLVYAEAKLSPSTATWMLEPMPDRSGPEGLLIGHVLTKPGTKGVPVRVMNPTAEDVYLRKGTCLGQLWPVEPEEVIIPQLGARVNACSTPQHPLSSTQLPEHLQELFNRSTEGLTESEKCDLAILLRKHAALFASHPLDLGRTSVVSHSIDTGNARPIRQPPRRPPVAFADKEEEIIADQKKAGVIQDSTSPWASPLVYVKKKDGSIRPCVDYRKLNEVTEKDAYPLPRIDDCLDCLSGAKLFSTLDLQAGYWQIEVKEEDRPKTAFITRSGLYEYVTMPFGLTNGPGTFERCMELVLRGLQWKTLLIYLDDVILFCQSVPQSLEQLDEVFGRLAQAGLKLKPSKCELLRPQVSFLGHVVSQSGVCPDPAKVAKIKDWDPPRNVTEVRSFLGLCSYYRRFIQGFSTLAAPMNRLTEKGVPYEWTSECQQSFEALQQALGADSLMAYPTKDGAFILDTDASDTGIGAVLSQIQVDPVTGEEMERPILFASKSLSKAQRKYCVTRRELLAVVVFCQDFRHYLLGRRFTVRTDHNALRWLLAFRNPSDQMARWLELLSQYNFSIQHRPGVKHGNADALSRYPCPPDDCPEYDGVTALEDLPCGGCKACTRKHEQWSPFQQVDDVVPLTAKRVNPAPVSKDSAGTHPLVLGARQTWQYLQWLALWLTNLGSEALAVLGLHLMLWNEVIQADDLTPPRVRATGEQLIIPGGWIDAYTPTQLAEKQTQDPDLAPVIDWLQKKEKPSRDEAAAFSPVTRNLWLQYDQLSLQQGVLCRSQPQVHDASPCYQLVVPKSLQKEVLASLHDSLSGAHLGLKKTVSKLKQRFYWFGFKTSVRDWIRNCVSCGARKRPHHTPRAPLQSYRVGAPMDRVAMDIVGPFPLSNQGNRYILVIQDHFTKWTEAYALPDYTATTVAKMFVYEFVSRFGAPLEVHTDQGRNFEADLFKEMCQLLGAHKTRTSPYRPCSNGSVERFNSTLLKMITAYVSQNQGDWDEHLPLLTSAYRSSEQQTTQFTPNQLMLGREVMLPIQVLLGVPDPGGEPPWYYDYVADLQERMNKAFSLVREHFKAAQRTQKDVYDTRVANQSYQEGDAVFTRDDVKKIGKSPKLKTDPWKGPYIITRRFSSILFEVRGHPKSKPRVLHHDRLKPYPEEMLPSWAKRLQTAHRHATPQKSEQGVQTEGRMETADLLETPNNSDDGGQPCQPTPGEEPAPSHKPTGRPRQMKKMAAQQPSGHAQPNHVKGRQMSKKKQKKRSVPRPQGQPHSGQEEARQQSWQERIKKSAAPQDMPRRGQRQRRPPERFGQDWPSELVEMSD